MTKNEAEHLVNGRLWLTRARQDFAAFKRFVPLTRNNYRTVRVSDPALAIYLLQQAHEKAAKAVALASGKYGQQDVRHRFRHRSPTALLQFFIDQRDLLSDFGAGPLLALFQTPAAKQPQELEDVRTLLPKWEREFARAEPENVLRLFHMLQSIREAMLGALKRAWGPHTSLSYVTSTGSRSPDIVCESEEFWIHTLRQPSPPKEQLDALRSLVEALRCRGLFAESVMGPERVVVRRNADALMYSWAVYTLFALSCLTWPHQATARYPRWQPHSVDSPEIIGAQDYGRGFGLVTHLGYAGYLTGLALEHFDAALDNAAMMHSLVAETASETQSTRSPVDTGDSPV